MIGVGVVIKDKSFISLSFIDHEPPVAPSGSGVSL
jgi:hypothetical protein